MKRNSKWMPVTIVCLVLSFAAAQLEPVALGQNVDGSVHAEGRAANNAVQEVSPVAPVDTRGLIARATLPPQAPAPAAPRKSRRWKWIVVVAAAVATGVTAAVLARDDTPSIMVGNLSVGTPQ